VKLGVPRENIWVTDIKGVVYEGRDELMDETRRATRRRPTRARWPT
jgi:malic enzyme